jgi:hypothetical protein
MVTWAHLQIKLHSAIPELILAKCVDCGFQVEQNVVHFNSLNLMSTFYSLFCESRLRRLCFISRHSLNVLIIHL